jgi:two-component system response regulator TctD
MDVRVLFVCPHPEDAGNVSRMLEPAQIQCDHVANCREARSRLAADSYDAVLTEAYLPDGDWKDVLNLTFDLGPSPAVIVTHRVADDRFWAEVLNLGCYDMLAQPFDTREVQRILALACAQNRGKPMSCAAVPAKSLSNAV